MATINLEVGFEIDEYVLGKWVISIARDFASDGQKCSNIQSLTGINLVGSLEGKSWGCPTRSKTYIYGWEADR
jgi:hypothetical protein